MLRFLAVVSALAAGHVASAQIATVEPSPPRAGETMYVTYDPSAAGATLASVAERYAAIELTTAAGTTTLWGKLAVGSDGVVQAFAVPLPLDAERGEVRFFTLDERAPSDDGAVVRFTAVRPGGHGILPGMSDAEIEERLAAHRATNPSDPSAWIAKWIERRARSSAEEFAAIVRSDLVVLETAQPPVPFARAWGSLQLGDDAATLAIVEEMIVSGPSDPWTARAVESLAALVDRDDAGRWKGLAGRYADLAPGAAGLRHGLLERLAADPAWPLEAIDRCAAAWSLEQPEDARPLIIQATARAVRRVEPERGEELAARALELILKPAHRAFADPRGDEMGRTLANVLGLRSELATARGDATAALVFSLAAKGASGGTSDPAVVVVAPLQPVATELVAQVIPTAASDQAAAPAAPTMAIGVDASEVMLMDLDGSLVRLADFRGKVVVLNLWFAGCGPCKVEMPRLNQLLDRFADRDVVFLAPSLDGAEQSRAVARDRGFRYRVLADSMPLAQAFGVTGYPTHVVLDRTGNVALSKTGTGEDIEAEIASTVERLLGSASQP